MYFIMTFHTYIVTVTQGLGHQIYDITNHYLSHIAED